MSLLSSKGDSVYICVKEIKSYSLVFIAKTNTISESGLLFVGFEGNNWKQFNALQGANTEGPGHLP